MSSSSIAKITISAVESLPPHHTINDRDLKGFGVRRQAGPPTYFVLKRIQGRLRRVTIGRHGSPWTPETARREAASLLMSIQTGGNPIRERDERRQRAATFAEVAGAFLDLHGRVLKPSTLEVYRALLKNQLNPTFARKPMNEIAPTHVASFHAKWRSKPRTANHAVALLSKIINWAPDHGFAAPAENPCAKVKHYREGKRERFLSDSEVTALGDALRAAEGKGANPWVIGLIRLLLLTGARLGELLTLRWEYVDHAHQVLRLPDSKTGAKVIRLSQPALQILDALPRIDGNPWVFPGHIDGRHLVNIGKPWRAIRAAAGLPEVRLHDLRHSYASTAITVGGSLPMIGKLLGHSQTQTTARYAHVAPDPAQELADAAAARIARALRAAPSTRD